MKQLLLAGATLALLFASPPLRADDQPIARVPAVTENDPDPSVKEMFDTARAHGTKPINLQLITHLSPALAKARSEEANTIRFNLKVPRPYRELTILRTVQNWEGNYEFNQHRAMALACGFTQAQIDGLSGWKYNSLFDETQRALLAYIDELTVRPGRVDDVTFAALAKYFKPNEIVELTSTSTFYMGGAAFSNAMKLRTETDGRQAEIGTCAH
jgi:alkylhydroperoxidase family enzyme